MKDYYKKTKWFSIYTKYILPIFAFLNVLSLINAYVQADFSNADSILFVIGFLLDIIFCVLTIKTTIDIVGEETWAVRLLIALFGYNWIYKSIYVVSTGESEYLLGFILAFVIYALYYIPNIIYFYHRRDYFFKTENISNIKKKKKIESTNSSKRKDKTVWIACKICGKSIPNNENETREECNQKNLKRIDGKQENKDNEEKIYCIYCNAKLGIEDKFCCECGKEIKKIYCVKCGKRMNNNWKFCKYCGEKIN